MKVPLQVGLDGRAPVPPRKTISCQLLIPFVVLLVGGCLPQLLPERTNTETNSTNTTAVAAPEVVAEPAPSPVTPTPEPSDTAETETEETDESSVATTEDVAEDDSGSEEDVAEDDSGSEEETTEPVEVVENNPRYTPGEIEIPAEFLNHGGIVDLRYEWCSTRNGLLVKKSELVYSIPPPSDPIWRRTDARGGRDLGTRVVFADGTVYDGYVRDYTQSYPMPLLPRAEARGPAFWERDY